jgi:hypothetical protein
VKLRRHFLFLRALPLFLLAGCSMSMPSMSSLWPFGEGEVKENSRKPANATEYRCAEGKTFYVRQLDGGAVWLIAPDRDIRLDKKAEGSYGTGRVLLELGADGGALLVDPPASFSGCKRAS